MFKLRVSLLQINDVFFEFSVDFIVFVNGVMTFSRALFIQLRFFVETWKLYIR